MTAPVTCGAVTDLNRQYLSSFSDLDQLVRKSRAGKFSVGIVLREMIRLIQCYFKFTNKKVVAVSAGEHKGLTF
jgi:hypothetical protein